MEVDLAMLEQGRSVRRKRGRQRRWAITRTVAGIAALLGLIGVGLHWLTRSSGTASSATAPQPASIFVLPFRHSVPDPLRDEPNEADYDACLCNRLTDAFIDAVPLIPGASTGPRKSGWRGYHEDQVRRTMVQTNNTRYILTGRVDHTNEVLRLALRLYERRQDTPLWTETIEASINDTNKVIALEKRAIAGIASRLRLSVDDGIQRTIDQRLSHNLAAYHSLLRARSNYFTGFRPDWPQSVEHCQSALKLDPRYTAALVGWMLAQLESSGESAPRTYMWTLETGARELLAIDDTLEVAHDRLVFEHLYYDYNWERGGAELEGMRSRGFVDDLTLAVVLRTFGRMEEA